MKFFKPSRENWGFNICVLVSLALFLFHSNGKSNSLRVNMYHEFKNGNGSSWNQSFITKWTISIVKHTITFSSYWKLKLSKQDFIQTLQRPFTVSLRLTGKSSWKSDSTAQTVQHLAGQLGMNTHDQPRRKYSTRGARRRTAPRTEL